MKWWSSLFLALILNIPVPVSGADDVDTLSFHMPEGYGLANLTENVIHDEHNTLAPFFESLKTVARYRHNDPMSDTSLRTIAITQIGDSHIQAGMGTAITRKLFQQYFGPAGRGLVTPQRLSGSNEPTDYRFKSDEKWDAVRLLKPVGHAVGIGGLTLSLPKDSALLHFETLDQTFPGEWAFNEVIVYHNPTSALLTLSDSVAQVFQHDTVNAHTERFCLDTLTSSFTLKLKSYEGAPVTFYGFNLKSGRTGVLYHSIGINGARYANYCIAPLLCEQVGTLGSELIILSLGTNEAYERVVDESKLMANIDNTLQMLRESSPGAQFILATPAESLRRISRSKRVVNEKVLQVRNAIIKYAKKYEIAYWDFYDVAGGKGAAMRWQKQGLMVRDGIHFSKDGYEYQGLLLFDALAKAYNANLNN